MKIFKSKSKNIFYLIYRLINPLFDPINFIKGFQGYLLYLKDLYQFKKLDKKAKVSFLNLYPILSEKTSHTFTFDAHYFYNPIWAFDRIIKNRPKKHVDIASDYRLCGYLSRFIPTTFVDLRPIKTALNNLKIKRGDLVKLPFNKSSIDSLSCLHVLEHIGLGRYGDTIDPMGTKKAIGEIVRVLKKGGFAYIAIPIGKEHIYFNAHRVFFPKTIIEYFTPLKLMEFSVVNDDGKFIENTKIDGYQNQNYACGLFIFKKT